MYPQGQPVGTAGYLTKGYNVGLCRKTELVGLTHGSWT